MKVMSQEGRNLSRMLAVVVAARAGDVSLLEAVDSLLFLRACLEESDEGWDPQFTSLLLNLESVGLEPQSQIAAKGDEDYSSLINESLTELEQLIAGALGDRGE